MRARAVARATTASLRRYDEPTSEGNQRLYQQLAQALIAAIQSDAYKVGDRLPTERELAAEYRVSRPTVRKAIIALQVQGLVEVRLGSGAYMKRKPGADEPGRNVTALELTEARMMFESEAAALAAPLIADEVLDQLDALAHRIERESELTDGKERAHREFHALIAQGTRNAAVIAIVEALWRLRQTSSERALLLEKTRAAKVKPVVTEHMAIVTAMRTRDPVKARKAMRAHLRAVMDHLLLRAEERAVAAARNALREVRVRFGTRRV